MYYIIMGCAVLSGIDERLLTEDSEVVREAARGDEAVLRQVLQALRSKDVNVRVIASQVLNGLADRAEVFDALRSRVADMREDEDVRREACRAIGRRMDDIALNFLANCLESTESITREVAVAPLQFFLPQSERAFELLVVAMGDSDSDVRSMATSIMLSETAGVACLPYVRKGLDSDSALRQVNSASVIITHRPSRSAIDALCRGLRSVDRNVRIDSLRAFFRTSLVGTPRWTPFRGDIVADVANCLLDEVDEECTTMAAHVLECCGSTARCALPILLKRTRRAEAWIARWSCVSAYVRLVDDIDAANEVLLKALDDPSECVRVYTCEELAKLGSTGSNVLAALQRATHDADETVAAAARDALERLGRTHNTN